MYSWVPLVQTAHELVSRERQRNNLDDTCMMESVTARCLVVHLLYFSCIHGLHRRIDPKLRWQLRDVSLQLLILVRGFNGRAKVPFRVLAVLPGLAARGGTKLLVELYFSDILDDSSGSVRVYQKW